VIKDSKIDDPITGLYTLLALLKFWDLLYFQSNRSPLRKMISLFYEALKDGDLKKVKFLLENGADINVIDDLQCGNIGIPLTIAIGFGHVEIVKFLIENGADVNKLDCYGWTPLCAFSKSRKFKNLRMARLLIDHGAGVNHFGSMALVFATSFGNVELTKLLIENGANTNIMSGEKTIGKALNMKWSKSNHLLYSTVFRQSVFVLMAINQCNHNSQIARLPKDVLLYLCQYLIDKK
jgi:hypothetical protein